MQKLTNPTQKPTVKQRRYEKKKARGIAQIQDALQQMREGKPADF